VLKLSSAGAHLWSTYLGESNWGRGSTDTGNAIAVDGDGIVYVTGYVYNGPFSTFVVKLSASGAHLWSTYLVAPMNHSTGIAVDGAGNVYVTGYTSFHYLDTTHNRDAFLVKIQEGAGEGGGEGQGEGGGGCSGTKGVGGKSTDFFGDLLLLVVSVSALFLLGQNGKTS